MALTDLIVRSAKAEKPAGTKYTDGEGMYLLVTATGKYWRLNYRFQGKRKTLALGVYPAISLAKARVRRADAKALLADDIDPGEVKRKKKAGEEANVNETFEAIARSWLAKTKAARAPSTQEKVTGWLERTIFPYIGKVHIAKLGPRDVLVCVQRMESRGAVDSAHRVKQICGQVFRFAVANAFIDRDVTADLKGALSVPVRTNYAAITEPKAAGALMRSIYGYNGHVYAAAAMKLSAMLFVRPGELRSAEWSEIDLDAALWRIPGSKMKMRVDHLVPLPTQAVEILRELQPITGHGKYVFPSIRSDDRCMSENTVSAALRYMGYSKEVMTAHGFRAMARTILDEELGERVDLIEHQLAHAVIDPNGRAYNRTAHLIGRKLMMQRWADFLDQLRMYIE